MQGASNRLRPRMLPPARSAPSRVPGPRAARIPLPPLIVGRPSGNGQHSEQKAELPADELWPPASAGFDTATVPAAQRRRAAEEDEQLPEFGLETEPVDDAGSGDPPGDADSGENPDIAAGGPDETTFDRGGDSQEIQFGTVFEGDDDDALTPLPTLPPAPPGRPMPLTIDHSPQSDDFPLDAFIIPDGAERLPTGLVEADRHKRQRATDLADRLESLARRLRAEGYSALARQTVQSDPIDALIAGILAGYLARNE